MRKLSFVLLISVLCGWAQLSFAQAPAIVDLPALFTVSNLDEGDILNVRAKPSAGSKDIGDLKPSQAVEVVRLGVDGKWARIIWGESEAWVHRNYLTPVMMPRLVNTGLPAQMNCSGTEPSWGLTIKDGSLTYSDPVSKQIPEPLAWEATSANNVFRHAVASASWRALIQKKVCSDGMSDIVYGLSIDLLSTDGQRQTVLSGCCRIAQ